MITNVLVWSLGFMALLWLWDKIRKRRVWAIGNVDIDMIDLDGCNLSRKDNIRRTLTEISIVRPDAIVIPQELALCESLMKTCEINHIPAIIVDISDVQSYLHERRQEIPRH